MIHGIWYHLCKTEKKVGLVWVCHLKLRGHVRYFDKLIPQTITFQGGVTLLLITHKVSLALDHSTHCQI